MKNELQDTGNLISRFYPGLDLYEFEKSSKENASFNQTMLKSTKTHSEELNNERL